MKLLASDFDNTLWFEDHMNEEDASCIKLFQSQNNLFGLCTGRHINGINGLYNPYGIHYDFYIMLNGSIIYDADLNVIYQKNISTKIAKEIYYALDEPNASFSYYDDLYLLYTKPSSYKNKIYSSISSIDEINTDNIISFSFHYEIDEMEKAQFATHFINDHYGQFVHAFLNQNHVDVSARGCSKGEGLKIIQHHFNISKKDTYCIGDSHNDLPMIKSTENSFTFTYSPQDVIDEAKYIVNNFKECIETIQRDA